MDKILSIDPGKTTGLCFGTLMNSKLTLEPMEAQLTPQGLYELLQNFMGGTAHRVHIVYEDFQYRNTARMGLNLMPVKLIGVIEIFQERYEPLVSFTKQQPAQGKGFYTDSKLRALQLWPKGMQHARDAIRHLLQWYTFGYGSQFGTMELTTVTMQTYKIKGA